MIMITEKLLNSYFVQDFHSNRFFGLKTSHFTHLIIFFFWFLYDLIRFENTIKIKYFNFFESNKNKTKKKKIHWTKRWMDFILSKTS